MSINISNSTFSGTTQLGYTNVMVSQIDELRNRLQHEGDVDSDKRGEATKFLEELKQKLERGASKSEVVPIWERVQELLSGAAKIAPLLVQIGKTLGM